MHYYNENDPYAAAWLRNLIAAGQLAAGIVDERDIRKVQANDLGGYDQHHFFAGIGGWPYALSLAGWPATRPIWTGSCPCQPFSAAGKREGHEDDRHLWPVWLDLIRIARPPVIIGEQVSGAIGFGWLDGIFADLETAGYACGATVLPACSVSAPHIRQRLFWVAVRVEQTESDGWNERGPQPERRGAEPRCAAYGLADTDREGQGLFRFTAAAHRNASPGYDADRGLAANGLAFASLARWEKTGAGPEINTGDQPEPGCGGVVERLGDTDRSRSQGCGQPRERAGERSPWSPSEPVWCRDGKWRRIPVEPSLQPLADGFSRGRVAVLRAAGNAIIPALAAEFIKAIM